MDTMETPEPSFFDQILKISRSIYQEDGTEYSECLSIREKMRQNQWAEALQQLDGLIDRIEKEQTEDIFSNLIDFMYLIFRIQDEGIRNELDKAEKSRLFSDYTDRMIELMSVQPLFDRAYIEQHFWQNALRETQAIYDPEGKRNYTLRWEDLFETTYFEDTTPEEYEQEK
jgi:hypothetical protein